MELPLSAEGQTRSPTMTVAITREDKRHRAGTEQTSSSSSHAHRAQRIHPNKIDDQIVDKTQGSQSAKKGREESSREEATARTIGALRMSKLLVTMSSASGGPAEVEGAKSGPKSFQSTQSFDAENLFFDPSDREDEASASSRSGGSD